MDREFQDMATSPNEAKEKILGYCLRKGALAAGIADIDIVERIAPEGHKPSDLWPRAKSIIALGVGGQTQGAWSVPSKALGYFGSTETRAYTIAYGCAFYHREHLRQAGDILSSRTWIPKPDREHRSRA